MLCFNIYQTLFFTNTELICQWDEITSQTLILFFLKWPKIRLLFYATVQFCYLCAASRQRYSSELYRSHMFNNVVGDPGDGRSEMTSSLSTKSKRRVEGGGGGMGRGQRAEQRMFHHPAYCPHGFYRAGSCWK